MARDPKAFELNVLDPEGSLAHASESALRHEVGTSTLQSILTEGRESLGLQVQQRLQRYMETYGTGIVINRVNIRSAQAPSQVQEAFDDVIKAREDEQRVRITSYNVCYTKLLRPPPGAGPRPGAQRRARGEGGGGGRDRRLLDA